MDAPNISELLLSDMIMSNLSDLLHTFTVQGDWGFYLLRVNKMRDLPTRFFQAASVTLLVLEAFSTLPDEVRQLRMYATSD
ncbi:hypothetical protein BD309DRAFT_877097 [Dichomitus squalens]|nr:hypothetical protein BD309DRAFT_877097 [Dichomitus squalens]